MLLNVLKHGGTWDFLAQMFRYKSVEFQRLITRYMEIIVKEANKLWVNPSLNEYNMDK